LALVLELVRVLEQVPQLVRAFIFYKQCKTNCQRQ
jgi:hypothetical protein